MKTSEMFPSKWLKGSDIPEGQTLIATIQNVYPETFKKDGKPDETKPVMSFLETKPLILNKSITQVIESLYGDESDHWRGRQVILYSIEAMAYGELTRQIRVKSVIPNSGPSQQQNHQQPHGYQRQNYQNQGYQQPQGYPQQQPFQQQSQQSHQQQSMPQPPQAGEPLADNNQKRVLLTEGTRVYGGSPEQVKEALRREFGPVSQMTYSTAEQTITTLMSRPDYRPPAPPDDYDDADPFADE